MFSQFLPRCADNSYRGPKLALWLFAMVLFVKLMQSLTSIFNARYAASGPDGIPIDTYAPAAGQTVIALFAVLGLVLFMFCLVCMVVLARYRNLVPLMFALLALHYLGTRLILLLLPIVRTGRPAGFYINLALFAVMIVGLVLSLRTPRKLQPQE